MENKHVEFFFFFLLNKQVDFIVINPSFKFHLVGIIRFGGCFACGVAPVEFSNIFLQVSSPLLMKNYILFWVYTLCLSQQVNLTHHIISLIGGESQQEQTHTKRRVIEFKLHHKLHSKPLITLLLFTHLNLISLFIPFHLIPSSQTMKECLFIYLCIKKKILA